ncbi:MAG: peptidase [Bacteroidetes bacterium]|nr:peptidase [Bacteroidota bacterium]
MRRYIFVGCFLLVAVLLPAQLVNRFTIDLTKSKKNKLSVRCDVPAYQKEVLVYQIPRAVPGSYSIKNFGDYIENFRAYDRKGKKLKVSYNRQDNNFTINNAVSLARISYDVRDTWTDTKNQNYVFQPGGTYFEPGTLFCLNTFALFGYFEDFEHSPSEVHIKKERGLYCSTSADLTALNPTEDVVKASDYNVLQDNPMVYMHPDTVSLLVNNCRFHIAVFSRNHKATSHQILSSIRPILTKVFPAFFPVFPTNGYTFTFIFPGWQDENLMKSGSMGAMEHSASSVYFYPETGNRDILNSFLTHVVTHEFLHVLTPLSLKSEQIFNFNYRNPEASQHLWLYEGGIEYLSNLILLRDSVMSENDYLESLRQKLLYSDRYQHVSMTEFGRRIFSNSDVSYYANVYNRGALVAFLLDIRINELTEGRMNLRKLLLQLDDKYKGRFFRDDRLFDEIVDLTHSDIRSLIDDYIVGTKELPVESYLHKIGYRLTTAKPDSIYTFGRVSMEYDSRENRCIVRDAAPSYNAFNLDKGDVMLAVNDTILNEVNYYQYMRLIGNPDSEKEVKVRFARKDRITEIQNSPIKVKVKQLDFIEPERDLTADQRRLRKLVLNR